MKSAEQIKGAVKNIAKKMNLKPQEVLQIFMFERQCREDTIHPD